MSPWLPRRQDRPGNVGQGGHEDVTLFERREGVMRKRRSLSGAHFVRLYGEQGFPSDHRVADGSGR